MIQVIIKNHSLNYTIVLHEYESIFSLKLRINESKDFSELNWKNNYLSYAGMNLQDIRSLKSYGIKNGSVIYLERKLNGGNLLKIQNLMIFGLIILILIFFTYLVTGFLPVFANIFYFPVKITIDKLIGVFKWVLSLIREEQATIADIGLQKGAFSIDKAKEQFQKQAEKKIEQNGEERAKSYNFLNILYDGFFFFLKLGFTFIFIFTASAGLILPLFWFN